MGTIELCREYYETYGKQMIKENFPEYETQIAVGVSGNGSDCFGFDDTFSTDHDSGVGFCMWLEDDLFEKIGFELSRKYSGLPKEYHGVKKAEAPGYGDSHFGVKKISDFFTGIIGSPAAPLTVKDWLYTPEYAFAAAINGAVFRDDSGIFSSIRYEITNGMPRDVFLKKMSFHMIMCAQSGQYNFLRCCNHGEYGAAVMALTEFAKHYLAIIYLINKSFCPYYKWAIRGAALLPLLGGNAKAINDLLVSPTNKDTADEKFRTVEALCSDLVKYCNSSDLSRLSDNFLEAHAYEIQNKIKNAFLRQLHIMEG